MAYKKMYLSLVDATTKAIELLTEGLQKAEKIYVEGDDAVVSLIPSSDEGTSLLKPGE